jgi:prophage DNA circulation protein
MSWRENLQKGSFRGAAFFWRSADGEIGRKTARHDYPLRDEAYIEDLGKVPREFTLEVIVIGPEYLAARDKLIAACEEAGPGSLVHPTMGTLQVALNGRVRISESTSEGGMCRFTLPFVLAGENKYPTAANDTSGAVATRADAALGKVKDDFGSVVTVVQKPAYIDDHLQGLATSALDKIAGVRGMIAAPLVPERVTALLATYRQLNGSVSALVRSPLELAAGLQGFVAGLSTLTDNPFSAFKSLRGLFDWGSDLKPVPRTTSNRIVQAENQAAMVTLIRSSAVIEAARAVSESGFVGGRAADGNVYQAEIPSYQEAVKVRDELADRLDVLMEDSVADDTYQSLAALRVAVITDINARGADLARTVAYRPVTTLPALVVAYQLYDDAERSEEIIARNRIRHPGFVTGGRDLEVLLDA